jgi:hypothetical protein
MNRYHRYLTLPFTINPPKIFENFGETARHIELDDYDHTRMNEFLSQFNLKVHIVECFYTPPFSKIPIHTDLPEYTDHVKINITWGPKEGVMQWWKLIEPNTETYLKFTNSEYTESNHHNLWAEEEKCMLIHEANTNCVSLVNVGVLHGTNNPTNEGRWTLCFAIKKKSNKPYSPLMDSYITWNESMNIFNDYIKI